MTIVSDLAKCFALNQELSALLAKDAIKPVDPVLYPGFYSIYSLVKKKCGTPIFILLLCLIILPFQGNHFQSIRTLPFPTGVLQVRGSSSLPCSLRI